MARDVIVAADIGTTGVKVTLVTADGEVVARGSGSYTTGSMISGSHVEQHPEEWWEATVAAVRSVLEDRHRPIALALTGQMQDVVLLRGDDVLRPALLYSDTRAQTEAESIHARLGPGVWERTTANEQDASSIPAKLLWLRLHEPDVVDQADRLLLGAHSYVAWRACGEAVCDPTTASTTGLFDFEAGDWFAAAMEVAETSPALLPGLHEPYETLGALRVEAAAELGCPAGIPVVHGPGDASATSLGAGTGAVGDSFVYLGTSGWVATVTAGERADPGTGIFTLRHVEPGQTLKIGAMVSVGANLAWARQELLGDVPWSRVDELAAGHGPTGLIYLPYPAGERSPFRDPSARAGFLGIGSDTTQADLIRAVMEGIAYSLRNIERTMTPDAKGTLVVGGGGCRSDVWCEILAAVLGRPLERIGDLEDVGALGAAVTAARALAWSSADWKLGLRTPSDRFEPDPDEVASYRPLAELHARVQPQIRDLTRDLHHIRQFLRESDEPTDEGEP